MSLILLAVVVALDCVAERVLLCVLAKALHCLRCFLVSGKGVLLPCERGCEVGGRREGEGKR